MPMKHSWGHLSPLRSSGRPAGFLEEQRAACRFHDLRAAFRLDGPAKGLCGSVFRRVGTASSGLERETAVIDLKDTAAADPIAFRLY